VDHDKQLPAALRLLNLRSGSRTAEDIERVSDVIGTVYRACFSFDNAREILSKSTRAKLIALRGELRRTRAAYNALPPNTRRGWFPDLDADLRKYEERYDRIVEQHWIEQPRQRRSGFKERIAVLHAHRLHAHYGLPIKASRTNTWCGLAAVLFGDEDADMLHYCCEYLDQLRA
jgi:hypothetical protein